MLDFTSCCTSARCLGSEFNVLSSTLGSSLKFLSFLSLSLPFPLPFLLSFFLFFLSFFLSFFFLSFFPQFLFLSVCIDMQIYTHAGIGVQLQGPDGDGAQRTRRPWTSVREAPRSFGDFPAGVRCRSRYSIGECLIGSDGAQ